MRFCILLCLLGLLKVEAATPTETVQGYYPLWKTNAPNIADLVLIYHGGDGRLPYSVDQFAPYVSYTATNGQEQWLFDGFLFIEFRDGRGRAYGEGGSLKPARKEDWLRLLDRNFEPKHGVPALEEACAQTAKRIGKPIRPRQVVLTLPEPYFGQINWGAINARQLDFNTQSDRQVAANWYITTALQHWKTLAPKHLQLAGFYWVTESTGGANAKLLPEVSELIHKQKLHFFWIPYWQAASASRWRDLGFDVAYQQPNHFFHPEVADSRLDESCAFARQHGLGMEFEMDGRAVSKFETFAPRFHAYLDKFTQNEVQKRSAVAYYEGGGALLELANSRNHQIRALYNRLSEWIVQRQRLADENYKAADQ